MGVADTAVAPAAMAVPPVAEGAVVEAVAVDAAAVVVEAAVVAPSSPIDLEQKLCGPGREHFLHAKTHFYCFVRHFDAVSYTCHSLFNRYP